MAESVVVLGTGDQAVVCASALATLGIQVAAFIGRVNRRIPADKHRMADFGDCAALKVIARTMETRLCIAALGDNSARASAQMAAEEAGFHMTVIVHPTAIIDVSASIGAGVFVGPGAVIIAGAILGRGVLVNTAAIVEHDCVLNDFSSVYSGAVLGGSVTLNRLSAVGLNATILPGLSIGEGCVVAAGAVVTRDQPARSVVVGNPGRVTRERSIDEPYVS
jgi:UDP-N-acetylbacillosamine N-acetyltransferase